MLVFTENALTIFIPVGQFILLNFLLGLLFFR
jgi:hypothetical protein